MFLPVIVVIIITTLRNIIVHVCLGRRRTVVEHIDLKVQAKVGTICMKITSNYRQITALYVDGITAGFIMQASYSQANINLSSISIKDLNEASIYRDVRLHSLVFFFPI